MKNIKGLTLIELMIALAISSVVAIGVMKAYVGQTVVVVKQARITQATEDGREAFSVISRLLRQAQRSSLSITPAKTTFSFTIPSGLAIWPNNIAPYTNNAVRLSWTDQGADANKILLATADSAANLGAAATITLAGDSSLQNTQIAAFTLTDNNDGSYSLKLISQIVNGASQTPLRVSFEGRILPRN